MGFFSKLFEPIAIGKIIIPNRIIMPAMVTNYGSYDGHVTEQLIGYLKARAEGGFGLIITENLAVHPWGRAFSRVLGIWDDDFIDGLAKLVCSIHKAGARIFAQIYHAGSQTSKEIIGVQPVAPSAVYHPHYKTLPRPLSKDEILELIDYFGHAARRVKDAGFDGIEVHGSHGYLIAQFMSPFTNKRTDEFGGNIDGRIRFPIEIIKSIRKQVGIDFPIILRLAGDERVSDGRGIDESRALVKVLEENGYDSFHITTATTATQYFIVPPLYVAPAFNVYYAEQIKKSTRKPVIVTGNIYDPFLAKEIIEDGRADLVGMGRSAIADPQLPNKIKYNKLDDINSCVGCLQGCVGSLYYGRGITCMANPDVGKEYEILTMSGDNIRKILVIGGGPAGLEVSRVLAKRGFDVHLWESGVNLGGQLILASMPPHKQRFSVLIKQMIRNSIKSGVKIEIGKKVNIKDIKKFKPDCLVIATGGVPKRPNFIKRNEDNWISAWDILSGKVETGHKTVIIGGGSVGCETADLLSSQGKEVTIIEMREDVGLDLLPRMRFFLLERLKKANINIICNAQVKRIMHTGVEIMRNGKLEKLTGFHSIVIALGTEPNRNLPLEKIKKLGIEHFVVGDAAMIGDALSAILSANELGKKI